MTAAQSHPDLHELVDQLSPAQADAVRAVLRLVVTPSQTAEPATETLPRKLAFVGAGASGTGITNRIDELLADGFGRD
jgi:hypothetical protein